MWESSVQTVSRGGVRCGGLKYVTQWQLRAVARETPRPDTISRVKIAFPRPQSHHVSAVSRRPSTGHAAPSHPSYGASRPPNGKRAHPETFNLKLFNCLCHRFIITATVLAMRSKAVARRLHAQGKAWKYNLCSVLITKLGWLLNNTLESLLRTVINNYETMISKHLWLLNTPECRIYFILYDRICIYLFIIFWGIVKKVTLSTNNFEIKRKNNIHSNVICVQLQLIRISKTMLNIELARVST